MNNKRGLKLVVYLLAFGISLCIPKNYAHKQKMNVLLIVADDLRTTLSCYGDTFMKTPNLDRLASRSVLFSTVASQQAVCAPSRTSFLTSRRPDTTKLYSNKNAFYWRDKVGNFSTLPQYFKESGYFTASVGKVFHPGLSSNETSDYPYSWSIPPYIPSTLQYDNAKVCPNEDGIMHTNLICPVDVAKQPEGTLPDIQNTHYALQLLQQFSSQPRTPFFLAVGFYKPHISFKYPKEFLDLYPIDEVPMASDPFLPISMPQVAYEPWTDIRWREDVAALNLSFPYGPVPELFARKIRQNYFAATSYIDSLIGDLLEGIQRYGFRDNTVVVLIGDHGWALGEHDEWCKYSNFRVATNVPLIVHVPNLTDMKRSRSTGSKGIVGDQLVELVDLMPSLAEICGLKNVERCQKKSSKVLVCTEGLSFYPLLKDPSLPWKKAIFSQYPRPSDIPAINTCLPKPQDIRIMGYSMQTAKHRYTEWIEFNPKTLRGNWSNVHARELYISKREDKNVASLPEFAETVKKLSAQLKAGWMGALPDQ